MTNLFENNPSIDLIYSWFHLPRIYQMAPDRNSFDSNGKWDYSTPGSSGYEIPDIVYNVSLTHDK